MTWRKHEDLLIYLRNLQEVSFNWQRWALHFVFGGQFSKFQISCPRHYQFKMLLYQLIHSANPKSRPVGINVFAHVVRPSPLFKSRKTKQQKTMFATGVTMGLAEWIINDTCLLIEYFWTFSYLQKRFFLMIDDFKEWLIHHPTINKTENERELRSFRQSFFDLRLWPEGIYKTVMTMNIWVGVF